MPVIAEISNEMLETVMESPEMDSVMLQAIVSALAINSRQDLAEMKTHLPKKVIVQSMVAKKGHRPVRRNHLMVKALITKNR